MNHIEQSIVMSTQVYIDWLFCQTTQIGLEDEFNWNAGFLESPLSAKLCLTQNQLNGVEQIHPSVNTNVYVEAQWFSVSRFGVDC